MRIDWLLFARAAKELDEALRGVRLTQSYETAEGMAFGLKSRGGTATLHLAVFGNPPLVWLADEAPPDLNASGAIRAIGNVASGMIFTAVRCVQNERVLAFELQRRSRFGVVDTIEVVVELIPRFGNVIVCKDGMIIAALREFSLAENPARAIEIGRPYVGPPSRLRREAGPDDAQIETESVLAEFARFATERDFQRASVALAAIKARLLKRVEQRAHTYRSERASIADRQRHVEQRGDIREQGQAIFATLYELAPEEREEAKERAQACFKTYRKLESAAEGLARRAAVLDAALEAAENEAWEISRADADALAEIATEFGERDARIARSRNGPQAPLEIRTPSGSRILVGRSSKQNVELTFRTAKPDDLWFHAQRVPGAHVVLARDDRNDPPHDDILMAAALAAHHSKARNIAAVPVDYTRRKHVRKQKDAPPGLVWYTDFSTILANPNDAPNPGV